MATVYPCVPGHEIIGRVMKAEAPVKKFKAGDLVGVWMHGGLGPDVSELQSRRRTVLSELSDADV